MTIAVVLLVSAGTFFLLMGAIGLLRLPDFYARMHAAGKCDTLGSLLILSGLAIHQGVDLASAKLVLIAIFIFVTSPTATHAIAWSARQSRSSYSVPRPTCSSC